MNIKYISLSNKSLTILSTLAAISCFMMLAPFAHAQDSVNLTYYPTTQRLSIKPGETQRVGVVFVNNDFSPIQGSVGVADFLVRENNTPQLIIDNSISTRYSAASWVKLNDTNVTIAAQDRYILYANVSVPKDALPGGHYISMYFETANTTPNNTAITKTGEAAVTHQYAPLISIIVPGNIKEEASVHELSVPSLIEHGPFNVKSKILNDGFIDINPKATVSLYNMFGSKIQEAALTSKNIFPESVSNYTNALGHKWMLGRYRVTLNGTYGNDNKTLLASAYMWVIPWKEGSVIVLAIIILGLLINNMMKKSRQHDDELNSSLQEDKAEIEKLKAELRKREE